MENFERVNKLEQIIWASKQQDARFEWDDYADALLGRAGKETWDSLYDSDLNDAERTAQEIITKYNLTS